MEYIARLEILLNISSALLLRMLPFLLKMLKGRPSPQWTLSTPSKEVEDHCMDTVYDSRTHINFILQI